MAPLAGNGAQHCPALPPPPEVHAGGIGVFLGPLLLPQYQSQVASVPNLDGISGPSPEPEEDPPNPINVTEKYRISYGALVCHPVYYINPYFI